MSMSLQYTSEQKQAIAHREGNLLIIACAGSGKTEVISQRIAQMVNEGVRRNEIVAFTFTDRAAHELKARIRKHLEQINPDSPSLGDMYVGTIHSFCLQLLKEIDPKYRNFEVLDEVRQAAIIAANYKYFPDSNTGIGLDLLRLQVRGKSYWETLKQFTTSLSVKHLKGIATQDIVNESFRNAVERYEKLVYGKPNYFFDFDTIVNELVNLIKNNPVELEKIRSKFQHLIVDEYQDIDPRQEELIKLLTDTGSSMSLCVVGDDDQAIYGWRGADIKNILKFQERYPDVTRIELVNNFRSTHAIVEIANAAVRNDRLSTRLNKNMTARFWESESNGEKRLVERMTEKGDIHQQKFQSDIEEAEWVASRIKALRGTIVQEKDGSERAIDYIDMSILLRSVRSSGQVFIDALQKQDIPFIVKGTHGLFSNKEVLLVYSGFCQLAKYDFSYKDLNGDLKKYNVDESREFIRTTINELKDCGAMPNADANNFIGWIAETRARLHTQSLPKEERAKQESGRIYPQDLFQEMLEKLGARSGENPWGEKVLYNLGRFSNLLTQFESVHQWVTPKRLGSLCLFLGGWAAIHADDRVTDEVVNPNAVQIMTVHASKGLEWEVVFIPRISSGNFPSSRRNAGVETFFTPDEFNPKELAGGDDGERRLWYVAITRCRKFLHISSQDKVGKKPSNFFKEIRHDYIQKDNSDPAQRRFGIPTPPIETELLPTSFSDLNYYWKCPFDYQMRKMMGFGPSVKQDFGYGQQVHNILAEIHQRASDYLADEPLITQEELVSLIHDRFNLRYTRGEPFEILKSAALKSVSRYLTEYPDSITLSLEAEKPFEFLEQQSGALISGTIDLLERVYFDALADQEVRTPVSVVDFKSQKWDDTEEGYKIYQDRKKDVTRQLILYATAVQSLEFDSDNGAYAHFLAPKPPSDQLRERGVEERFRVEISSEEQYKVQQEVAQAVAGIKSNKFPLTGCQTGRCKQCDFAKICPGSNP